MRRFRFSLESVLRVRRHAEDLAVRALAEAQAALEQAQAQVTRIDQLTDEMYAAFDQESAHPTTAPALAALVRYLRRLSEDRMAAVSAVVQAELVRDKCRAARVEAAKEVRILERLRERQLHAWQERVEKIEREGLDEMGARQWRRGRSAGRAMTGLLLAVLLLILAGGGYFYFLTEQGRSFLREVLVKDLGVIQRSGRSTGPRAPVAAAPANPIISASDVLALPPDERSRILGEAGAKVNAEWDRLRQWEGQLRELEGNLAQRQATLAAWEQRLETYARVVDASFAALEQRLHSERETELQAKKDRVAMVAEAVRAMDSREAARYLALAPDELAYNVLPLLSTRTLGEIFSEMSRVASATDTARLMNLLSETRRERMANEGQDGRAGAAVP